MSKAKSKSEVSQISRALSVLNQIGQTLTAIENPTEVLHRIAQDAKEVLGADIVDLYEYDQARNQFSLPPVLVGERRDPFVPKDRIYDDDVVYKVVRSGQPEYFPDAQGATRLTGKFEVPRPDTPDNRFVVREGVLSSVALPLRAGNEAVGVMFVNFRSAQGFDAEQKALIESFSNLAAIAIYNSRLWNLQSNQLSSLKEIIDVIGAENPLPAILNQAVTLFAANHGSISRLTEDGQNLQFQARWKNGNLLTDLKNEELQPVQTGILGHVVRSREPFRCGDVHTVEFYKERFSTTISEMAIPLKNAFDGVVGVLNLESDYPEFFTEEHQKLCVSFANAASAAIQQSDLIENVRSLHALTEGHSLKELLDRMLKNLVRMLGANTAASVNLYDGKNDNFYSFAGVGPSPEFVEKFLLVPPRENGIGRFVLNSSQPLFYEDVKNINPGLPQVRDEAWDHQICSFAGLPLIYRDEILGTLFIHRMVSKMRFTEDAIRVLQTYATQTALAIHNAQRRVDIQPFTEILSATVSEPREKILNRIVQKTVDIMDSDYASIWLGDNNGDLMRQAIYVRPEEQEFLDLTMERIPADRVTVNMNVFKTGKPQLESDVSTVESEGVYNRIYKKARSELAVPLIFRNERIGTLNTESQNLGAFSAMDMATLRLIADVATIAITVVDDITEINAKVQQATAELSKSNAVLERKSSELIRSNRDLEKRTNDLSNINYRLKRRNASFEVLTQIGQQLTANVQDESKILAAIHQEASRVMDTDNMYIALYDPKQNLVSFGLAFIDGDPVQISSRADGKGRTEWIIRNKQPLQLFTKDESDSWYEQPDAQEYLRETFTSWLGVPIMFGDEVLGVIATYHKTEEYKFDSDDKEVLSLMGRQAAIALQNARLIRQLDERIAELDRIRLLGEELSRKVL
jgi:GAF domain-containing protein